MPPAARGAFLKNHPPGPPEKLLSIGFETLPQSTKTPGPRKEGPRAAGLDPPKNVCLHVYSFVKSLYKTGTTIRVNNVEVNKPPMIVQPNGAHKVPPRSVRGNNPPIVVPVVNMIGINRVSPASIKDSNIRFPSRRSWFV